MSNSPPLYGLVLAGGRSRRMGRDKAAIAYQDGVPHARRTAELLAAVCARVFISCRADQAEDPVLAGVEKIPDAFDVGGPLNGILSAQAAHPDAAFLVAACDLPFLSAPALEALVAGRDVTKPVTAFENPARENFLEPLCAIYEPAYSEQARFVMNLGLGCPTKIADALDTNRLQPGDALFLDNANRPEDFERALSVVGNLFDERRETGDRSRRQKSENSSPAAVDISDPPSDPGESPVSRLPSPDPHSDSITIEYFAVFRAQAKRAAEEIPLDGSSVTEVYDRLRARHGFALERASVHVAINDVYASWDARLNPGDRLVFIPPVSGG
jgi:molybdopterin-guanine dinucleotide biosynthesis protein A